MNPKKPTETLPALTADELTEVWGGANRQAAQAERARIEDMQRRFVRTRNDEYSRLIKR